MTASDWNSAQRRARDLVDKLSNEEKAILCSGTGWKQGPALGNIAPVDSIGFPGLALQDGPAGLRWVDRGSAPPSQLNAASTWNKELIRRRGEMIGKEARGKGIQVVLAPCMNMMRTAAGGRNFESSGADPYLQGEVAYHTIQGIQSQQVQATAKHYICNEQEHYRQTSDSQVDDQTLHEMYLHPFLRSVQADVASVMTSYNQLNGVYTSEHRQLLHDILRVELGFKGFTQSDWWAQKSDIPSAAAGLDMTMPGEPAWGDWDHRFFGDHLVQAVQSGELSQERLDDMARSVLTPWLLLGQDQPDFEPKRPNFWCWDLCDESKNQHVDVAPKEHRVLCRQVAEASIVLLKNQDGLLPLKQDEQGHLRSLVLLGKAAGDSSDGPSLSGNGGPGWDDYVEQSISGGVPVDEKDSTGSAGVAAMGWGSGTAIFPYLISPLNAIQKEALELGGVSVDWMLDDSKIQLAKFKAKRAQVAIVFLNAPSGEEYINVKGNRGDRNHLHAWEGGNELVKAVAQVNPNTIVVGHTAGPILMEEWIDQVKAVVWCGLPGQEAGSALANVLFGNHNPSGRLPYTIAKSREDYGVDVVYQEEPPITPIPYHERMLFDYRRFLAQDLQPRFEFGFGLSYTRFEYSDCKIEQYSAPSQSQLVPDEDQDCSVGSALHQTIYQVTCLIKNVGQVSGTEIAQLYVRLPGDACRVLRGFEHVPLDAGQTQVVRFPLSTYALSKWHERQKRWVRPEGRVEVEIGKSCQDIQLRADL